MDSKPGAMKLKGDGVPTEFSSKQMTKYNKEFVWNGCKKWKE